MTKLSESTKDNAAATTQTTPKAADAKPAPKQDSAEEIGGPKGPEPTRFGDWEQKGRCSDF